MIPMICFEHIAKIKQKGPTNDLSVPFNRLKSYRYRVNYFTIMVLLTLLPPAIKV